MAPRYAEKFESLGADISFTFGLKQYEMQEDQDLRNAFSQGTGADYPHDHLGYTRANMNAGLISVRNMAKQSSQAILESVLDEARAECLRIGKGYLYRLDSDGSTRRRCLARLAAMVPFTVTLNSQFNISPQVFRFHKLSDWMATSSQSGSQTITEATLVSITNPGNLDCADVTFTITALAAAGFSSPSIRNLTTGQRVYSTRVADSEGEVWRVRTGAWAVEVDTSPGFYIGDSFIGQGGLGPEDYENDYSRATVDNGMPLLRPGVNQLLIEGLANATFAHEYTPRYV